MGEGEVFVLEGGPVDGHGPRPVLVHEVPSLAHEVCSSKRRVTARNRRGPLVLTFDDSVEDAAFVADGEALLVPHLTCAKLPKVFCSPRGHISEQFQYHSPNFLKKRESKLLRVSSKTLRAIKLPLCQC